MRLGFGRIARDVVFFLGFRVYGPGLRVFIE